MHNLCCSCFNNHVTINGRPRAARTTDDAAPNLRKATPSVAVSYSTNVTSSGLKYQKVSSVDNNRALDTDEYSYLTATYYLLAERFLRKERQQQAQKLVNAGINATSQTQIASLALSPRLHHRSTTYLSANIRMSRRY